MSYARWTWDGSDVYVILSVDGYLYCINCDLDETTSGYGAHTTAEMIDHLYAHCAHGDTVPDRTFDRLAEDGDENDEWMAEYARLGRNPDRNAS